LFENTRVNKSLVNEVLSILSGFEGECVLVLPGNHDYDDGLAELWKRFKADMGDKIIFLNENKVYNLQTYDLEVNIYPAYCNQSHSDINNIAWIREAGAIDRHTINIGIAHGALEGTSPDVEGNYYFMSKRELEEIPLDLWLLGHCHVRYPDQDFVEGQKIFNSGTPEPDGMNYSREGNAWIIEIEPDKTVRAKSLNPGQFRFYDLERQINSEDDFAGLTNYLLDKEARNKLVRLHLAGSIDEELLDKKAEYYRRWEEDLAFFSYDDSELRPKISRDIIEREFTHDSFPYNFLQKLADDPQALQIAYELIRRVK
jgi:DNA repair exonuclease SbcCD nuclease subunit